jgi:hypothetical protein
MQKEVVEMVKIIAAIEELEPNASLTLPDIANDGLGGVVVKRHGKSRTFVFQREGSQERSRWADNRMQLGQEVKAYLQTGRLHSPDNVQGF